MPGSSKPVNLVKFMQAELHMSPRAAKGLVLRGCVTIDGHVIKATDNLRWTQRQLYGRLLHVAGAERSTRMFTPSARLEFADG